MEKILFVIYLVLSIGGMLLVKIGVSNPLSIQVKDSLLTVSAGFITILGLLLYIGSFLLWTKLVAMFDLSYFVPIATAITQVVVVVVAIFLFHETVTAFKICGICFAIVGIVLMSIK